MKTEAGEQPIAAAEARRLALEVPGWRLEEKTLKREFRFGDFGQAVDFLNRVAALAEELNHHPDMCVFYNRVELTLSTHRAGGLSHMDFMLAQKMDRLMNDVYFSAGWVRT